mmetsp:Transcript_15354/g.15229  ORF Transcript_15354/g.15229 Transcript_15354/m.15229 type:complete len:87 (-) Transcript_15354:14-274(-)
MPHRVHRGLRRREREAERKRRIKLIKKHHENKKIKKIAAKVTQMIQPYFEQNQALASQLAMQAAQSYQNEEVKESHYTDSSDDSDY